MSEAPPMFETNPRAMLTPDDLAERLVKAEAEIKRLEAQLQGMSEMLGTQCRETAKWQDATIDLIAAVKELSR